MLEEKTSEELEKMNAGELQAYWVAKIKHESEETEKRFKALEGKLAEKKKTDSDDGNENDSQEIEALKTSQEQLKETLKNQGLLITKLQKGEVQGGEMNSLHDAVKSAVYEAKDKLAKAAKSREGFQFNVKAVGDMTIAGNVTGQFPQATRFQGINDIAERKPKVYDLMPKLNIAGNSVEWVYETGQEGAAGATSEGASKNQIDNDFVVTSLSLAKQTAYFKCSTELLEDPEGFISWLRNKLAVKLFIRVNAFVLAQALAISTTFAAGTHANDVDNANAIDSLNVALDQIEIAEHEAINQAIFMYPSDLTALKYLKVSATDKRYVDAINEIANNRSLGGVPIITSTEITAGDFFVAELSKAIVIQKGDIVIDLGLDGNDFTKNMRTLLAEWRGEVVIQQNDRTAFVKGTFATTNAALETP